MSRTERLLTLLDALRRHRRPVTAAALAAEVGVSIRTIYRDVEALTGLGAPIDGEAGLGYLLREGFFLPPLMFSEDEIEALVLGARLVEQRQDKALADAARNALAKIATAAPRDLRDQIAGAGLYAVPPNAGAERAVDLAAIREAIRREQKVRIAYGDAAGAVTERVIWPIALAFYEGRETVAAWCELRAALRHFRTDRMTAMTPVGERYPKRRAALIKAWREEMHVPRGE